jgi:hypothetical protein
LKDRNGCRRSTRADREKRWKVKAVVPTLGERGDGGYEDAVID